MLRVPNKNPTRQAIWYPSWVPTCSHTLINTEPKFQSHQNDGIKISAVHLVDPCSGLGSSVLSHQSKSNQTNSSRSTDRKGISMSSPTVRLVVVILGDLEGHFGKSVRTIMQIAEIKSRLASATIKGS